MPLQLFTQTRKRRSPKIEIIPMVDVMFLLLVFYILSSLALHSNHGIPVDLPGAASSQAEQTSKEIVLTITKDGNYYLNKDRVEGDKLSEALTVLANSRPGGLEATRQDSITLNADLSTQHRYVVYAMDQLRKVGMNNYVIATQTQSVAPVPDSTPGK